MNTSDEWRTNTQQLFQADDTVSLILLLDKLTADVIERWKSTKGSTTEQITEIRDKYLQPTVIQIGWICLSAIRFHHPSIYREGLERLTRIYNLGRIRDLGVVQTGTHLSWTVPSKTALTQLYVIGSYATFRMRADAIRSLLDLQARETYRKSYALLLSHPLYESHSGEGTLDDCFNDALSQMTNAPTLLGLYFQDKTSVLESLCQFDLIAAYSLWLQGARHPANFVRYMNSYTNPVVELLIKQVMAIAIFGAFEPERFATFLGWINQRALHHGRSRWDSDEWTEPIIEFLKLHPRRDGTG